eukprot:s1547_g15.t1
MARSRAACLDSGSEKAWRLLSDELTIFKLYLAIVILSPVESVLYQQFMWQSDVAWLHTDLSEVPLIAMANFQRSPATNSINTLVECLMGCQAGPAQTEIASLVRRMFAHLYKCTLASVSATVPNISLNRPTGELGDGRAEAVRKLEVARFASNSKPCCLDPLFACPVIAAAKQECDHQGADPESVAHALVHGTVSTDLAVSQPDTLNSCPDAQVVLCFAAVTLYFVARLRLRRGERAAAGRSHFKDSAEAEGRHEQVANQHQKALLDTALHNGLIGDQVSSQSLSHCPSLVKPLQVVEFANRTAQTAPADSACSEIVPHSGGQDDPTASSTQSAIVLDNRSMEAASYLADHGKGLHGLADSEFAISEDLVKKAAKSAGFVSKSHALFHGEHSHVVDKVQLELRREDELQSLQCCQNLCGRYCKTEIKKVSLFHRVVDMVKSVGRILAKKRDIRNGNVYHLSPTCKLPVLLVSTPSGAYARLVCRVSLNPLDIDFQHCHVCQVDDTYHLTLQFERLPASSNMCPLIDEMTEFAIWFTEMWDDTEGCRVQLVMDYELDDNRDDVLVIRGHHALCDAEEIGESSFKQLLCHDGGAPKQLPEDAAMASAKFLLSKLNTDRKRQTCDSDAKSSGKKPALLPARSRGKKKQAKPALADDQEVSASDLLLAQICPYVDDPRQEAMLDSGLDNPSQAVDEVELDWRDAMDQRYGSGEGQNPPPAKGPDEREGKAPRHNKSGESAASSSELPQTHVASRAADLVPSDCDFELPTRTFIDPTNQRVLAEFSSGPRRALGTMFASGFASEWFNAMVCQSADDPNLVFQKGEWALDCTPGDLSGFDKLLATDPTRFVVEYSCAVPWYGIAQRAKYIEKRTANPGLRLRSDNELGPRIAVAVKNKERSGLEKPETWFCRLDIYERDNPGIIVKESEKCWEKIEGAWVNIQTGREGYYKRVNATEKETELTVELYNNEDALGDGDGHTRIFASASNAIAPQSDLIDSLDLPFFKLGNNPERKGTLTLTAASSSSAAPHASLQACALPDIRPDEVPEDDDDELGGDSDKENTSSVIGNPLIGLKMAFATPKAKPAGKAAAKSTSKPAAKPKVASKRAASSNGGGGKRAKVEHDEANTQIMQLRPAKVPRMSGHAEKSSDDKIREEFQEGLGKLKESLFGKVGDKDSEPAVTEAIKAGLKELGSFSGKVCVKRKSLKRRADAQELIDDLTSIIDEVGQMQVVCNKLVNNQIDAGAWEDLSTCATSWRVPDMIFRRSFKALSLTHLKFADWDALESLHQTIVTKLETTGDSLYQLILSDALARLLRSLPGKADATTWTAETMNSLRNFLLHFAGSSKLKEINPSFFRTLECLDIAASPDKHVPSKVAEIVTEMQAASSTKDHPDGGLSAIILGIKQGKMILRAAHDISSQGLKETAHLQVVSDHVGKIEECMGMISQPDFSFKEALTIAKNSLDAIVEAASKPSASAAAKTLLGDSKKKLADLIGALCRAYIRGPIKQWIEMSFDTYKNVQTFVEKPSLEVQVWKPFAQGKHSSKDAAFLCQTICDILNLIVNLDGLAIASARETLTASEAVKSVKMLNKIKENQWSSLKTSGLLDDALEKSFEGIVEIVKGISRDMVLLETFEVAKSFGQIMAKAACQVRRGMFGSTATSHVTF